MLATPCFGLCVGAPAQLRPALPGGARQQAVRQPRARMPAKRCRAPPRCSGAGGGSGRFKRDPDDLPESLDGDGLPTELTMSQQLLMRTYHEQIMRMNKKEVDKLCLEVLRQVIVKDNVLKMMGITATPWGEPPEPEDVEDFNDEFDGSDFGNKGGGGGGGGGRSSNSFGRGGGDGGDSGSGSGDGSGGEIGSGSSRNSSGGKGSSGSGGGDISGKGGDASSSGGGTGLLDR